MSTWNFALILVDENTEDPDQRPLCHLAEVYYDEEGKPQGFADATILSPWDLERVYKDVQEHGVNRWFYENGTFEWKRCEDRGGMHWFWTIKEGKNDG